MRRLRRSQLHRGAAHRARRGLRLLPAELASRAPGQPAVEPAWEALAETLDVGLSGADLRPALVHRSWSYENGGETTNERLEFLGDAVLGLAVTEELFRRHPEADEGLLSRMRIAVVSKPALAVVGRSLGVGPAVLLGRGEQGTGGRDRDSILADTVEAIIGLVHLRVGAAAARDLVLRVTAPLLTEAAGSGVDQDHKTVLQVLAAERAAPPPRYTLRQDGPAHDPSFTAAVALGEGEALGHGAGRSKKLAEQAAAADAVAVLRAAEPSGSAEATGKG